MKPLWGKCRVTFPAINFWVLGLRHNQTETRAGIAVLCVLLSFPKIISGRNCVCQKLCPFRTSTPSTIKTLQSRRKAAHVLQVVQLGPMHRFHLEAVVFS